MQGLRPFTRYLEFSGRSGRAEYWQWFALMIAGTWILQALQWGAGASSDPFNNVPLWIYTAVTFIPHTAVTFRRLHDRGHSGWLYGSFWILLGGWLLAALVGSAVRASTGDDTITQVGRAGLVLWIGFTCYLLVQLARPGDSEANAYGPPDAGPPARTSTIVITPTPAPTPPTAVDTYTAIERLGQLKERGLLSSEEFDEQKRRLLSPGDAAHP